MNPILRNILAVAAGVIVGSIVNMSLIETGTSIVPAPEGVDPTDIESIKANLHLYGPKHFAVPFLAHALGTFVGAILAALIAASHKMKFALGIGAFFFLGGTMMAFMLGGPAWFVAVDLVLAYFPVAFLGGFIGNKLNPAATQNDSQEQTQ